MNQKSRKLGLILAAFTIVLTSITFPITASAASDVLTNIWNKAAARQIYWCYNSTNSNADGVMEDEFRIKKSKDLTVDNFILGSDSSSRQMPELIANELGKNDPMYSCEKLLKETLEDKGIDTSDREALAAALGYEKTEDSSESERYTRKGNALDVVKNLFGYNSASDMELSQGEIAILYQSMLEGIYQNDGADIECNEDKFDSLDDTYQKVKLFDTTTNKAKTCMVSTENMRNKDRQVGGLDGNTNYWMHNDMLSYQDIIDKLNGLTNESVKEGQGNAIDTLEGVASTNVPGVINTGDTYGGSTTSEAEEGEEDPCFGQAGAIGWFVCPIMNFFGSILARGYENWIEPLLRTTDGVVEGLRVGDTEHGIYQAWGIFRDIANVVFVIMLLVIIFSQVTGFGIDNYGIKRLLPRLIVTAVLVNFSFIICTVAVDATQLIGASIQDFFINIANNINITVNGDNPKTIGDLIYSIVKTLVVVGAAAFASYLVVGGGFILPAATAIIGGAISIFFGFLLLGARQALIIVMVALSPVALALNMLPNTNTLFEKWRKAFMNLLLVYPATGLLLGGSYLASRVILTADENGSNFFLELVALALLVIPYFFIIPLVRSSMNAFGTIGARIANAGTVASRGSVRAIRQSEGYQAAQARMRNVDPGGLRSSVARNIGNIPGVRRIPIIGGGLRALGNGLQASRARQIQNANRFENEERNNRDLLEAAEMERRERRDPTQFTYDNMSDRLDQLARGNDQEAYYAQLQNIIRRHGGKKAAEAARRALISAGNSGVMSDRNRAATMATMQERFAQSFGGNDHTLNEYLKAGGLDSSGARVDFNTFEQNLDPGDATDQEVSQLSADNLQRYIQMGKISQVQAQSIKDNPELFSRMKETEQTMLGAYAKEGRQLTKTDAKHMVETNTHVDYVKPRSIEEAEAAENQRKADQAKANAQRKQDRQEEDSYRAGTQTVVVQGQELKDQNTGAKVQGYAAPTTFNANGIIETANGNRVSVEQNTATGETRYWDHSAARFLDREDGERVLNDAMSGNGGRILNIPHQPIGGPTVGPIDINDDSNWDRG